MGMSVSAYIVAADQQECRLFLLWRGGCVPKWLVRVHGARKNHCSHMEASKDIIRIDDQGFHISHFAIFMICSFFHVQRIMHYLHPSEAMSRLGHRACPSNLCTVCKAKGARYMQGQNRQKKKEEEEVVCTTFQEE